MSEDYKACYSCGGKIDSPLRLCTSCRNVKDTTIAALSSKLDDASKLLEVTDDYPVNIAMRDGKPWTVVMTGHHYTESEQVLKDITTSHAALTKERDALLEKVEKAIKECKLIEQSPEDYEAGVAIGILEILEGK